jgi:spermidine dehydrogenase
VKEQFRAGRAELLQTPFAHFEKNIREQLDRMLSKGGFDSAKDIKGITVNRWAHGYSYSPFALDTPEWNPGEEPWTKGRKPFGRIAIANADSGAKAFTDAAIDQAIRAVGELST